MKNLINQTHVHKNTITMTWISHTLSLSLIYLHRDLPCITFFSLPTLHTHVITFFSEYYIAHGCDNMQGMIPNLSYIPQRYVGCIQNVIQAGELFSSASKSIYK